LDAAMAEVIGPERAAQAELLRCIFGNLFRSPAIDPTVLGNGTVRSLAEASYADRSLPDGHLDSVRLGVLADLLEEAGVTDAWLLSHLRGPGPHVRGCAAVDALLGKG
jgi:hypothetical protein